MGFPKRRVLVLLLVATLLLSFAGCKKKTPPPVSGGPTYVPQAQEQIDYISIIRSDVFSEDSVLSQRMAEAVTLTLDSKTDEAIRVTVTAPDVCAEALAWFDSVSEADYSDEALEAKLLELMAGTQVTAQFELPVCGETVTYNDAFLDAVSCGVRDFYGSLTAKVIQEMEARING